MKAYLNLSLGLIIVLAFVFAITTKEAIINDGQVVYLRLAPVDPRSIMQGDYMRLRYEIADSAQDAMSKPINKTGYLVLDIDDKNVANFAGENNKATILDSQILFKYQVNSNRIALAPDSFLFQQGLRELYSVAEYGIFRVTGDEHLLVGLADSDLKEIKPPKE